MLQEVNSRRHSMVHIRRRQSSFAGREGCDNWQGQWRLKHRSESQRNVRHVDNLAGETISEQDIKKTEGSCMWDSRVVMARDDDTWLLICFAYKHTAVYYLCSCFNSLLAIVLSVCYMSVYLTVCLCDDMLSL